MGAWGEKAFENDAALDWLSELEAEGATALHGILTLVADADPTDDLDVDQASGAIAAAEVVAAGLGLARDRVPKSVIAWLDANARSFHVDDRKLARRAVERILTGASELRALWEEGGFDSDWHADVRGLLVRLGGDPSVTPQKKAPEKVDLRSLQALLTFLQARGLVPTKTQHARLAAPRDPAELRRWLARVVEVKSIDDLLKRDD